MNEWLSVEKVTEKRWESEDAEEDEESETTADRKSVV